MPQKLMVVLAVLCAALALGSCGESKPSQELDLSSPESTVKAHIESLKDMDAITKRANRILSKKDGGGSMGQAALIGEYKVGTASISGDTATVPVTYLDDVGKGNARPDVYHCAKEGEEWKISLSATFAEMFNDKGRSNSGN